MPKKSSGQRRREKTLKRKKRQNSLRSSSNLPMRILAARSYQAALEEWEGEVVKREPSLDVVCLPAAAIALEIEGEIEWQTLGSADAVRERLKLLQIEQVDEHCIPLHFDINGRALYEDGCVLWDEDWCAGVMPDGTLELL